MRPTATVVNMQMARLVATRSTCLRRNVGCVLVNVRNHVLSTGFNGRPAGWPHCNHVTDTCGEVNDPKPYYGLACPGAMLPSGQGLDLCEAIHAEQNALLQCRDVYQIESCFCTASPCITCLKLLLNTSCQHIFYFEEYPGIEDARALWLTKGRRALFERVEC